MNKVNATYINLERYLDKDIYEIFDNTIEFVGYITECDGEKYPYAFLQFSGNCVNIDTWLKNGRLDSDECNDMFNNGRKEYFEPCSEKDVLEILNKWYALTEADLKNAKHLPNGSYINMIGE